jgi:hypothetical protein
MLPFTHRRRTRITIAKVAIAAILGVLIFTPKMSADRADARETLPTTDLAAAFSPVLRPNSEQGE